MTDIDFKKLVEQEPEFAEFARTVVFEALVMSNDSFIKSLYSFYQIGMSTDQTIQWFINNIKLNSP